MTASRTSRRRSRRAMRTTSPTTGCSCTAVVPRTRPVASTDEFAIRTSSTVTRGTTRSADMPRYLISFDDGAMDHVADDLEAASIESRAVVRDAKAAGVWIFGGGLERQ